MEKILIIGCSTAMDDICTACSRCMVGFNRREGEFERYGEAELLGILGCGGCPGCGIVTRMADLKLWISPQGEIPTKVHIAPCVTQHCPHAETLIKKIEAKAGVEVIHGTHPYVPNDIFAQ